MIKQSMKFIGSLLKAVLTMVGIYLACYLIGRVITFVLRLALWPFSKYPLSYVFESPGFFICADLGFYSALSFGTVGAGLSGRFHGEQIAWALIFGVIFVVGFVGSVLRVIRYETNDDIESLESLRRKFKAIDDEYASEPDYELPKPSYKLPKPEPSRLPRYDRLGPELLN